MNDLEKKLVENLIDLKNNYHVEGVKAEFEAEGTRNDELLRLKDVVSKAGLDLTIKIGGCEAVKDLYEAKLIGAKKIVAPMIESPYALKKFLNTIKIIYNADEINDTEFLINIETITSTEKFEEMLELENISLLNGIVIGRVDMVGSLNLTRDSINSNIILTIVKDTFKKAKHLTCIVGGGVTNESYGFFCDLGNMLDKFETRKIIFNSSILNDKSRMAEGILKAVSFELMWLKNKKLLYGSIYQEDDNRIEMLEKRYQSLLANYCLI